MLSSQTLKKRIKSKLRVPELSALISYALYGRSKPNHDLPGDLIVSLTSYPKRYSTLHYSIKSLRSQSIVPNKIVLWLFEEDLNSLPASVTNLIDDVFEVQTVERNIRSYTKLVPALRAYPEAFIVTADDDIWYQRDWLKQFITAFRTGQDGPIGRRAHEIETDEDGNVLPYGAWKHNVPTGTASERTMLTGVAGILYPPETFDKRVLDEDMFMHVCPSTDDLWFYFLARQSGKIGRKIGEEFDEYQWRGSQEGKLWLENLQHGGNDKAMAGLVKEFGMPF